MLCAGEDSPETGMRILIVIVLALAVLVAAAAGYLIATTPRSGDPLRFPLEERQRELLARVPPSAEMFALVPSAGLLQGKLLANPVSRDAVQKWTEEHELPRPWMMGNADVVLWKADGMTTYALRLDRFRALLLRIWLSVTSNVVVRWDGATLIMNEPPAATGSDGTSELDRILELGEGLPESDVLLVQLRSDRGAFPPIGRPAITAVTVTPEAIMTISRAEADEPPPGVEPIQPRLPAGALLAAAFTQPPRILSDLNRILGARLDVLLDQGGLVALYDLDSGTLIPRPRGIIAVPNDERRRSAARELIPLVELIGETREIDEQIVISLDRSSMDAYQAETLVSSRWPVTRWAASPSARTRTRTA